MKCSKVDKQTVVPYQSGSEMRKFGNFLLWRKLDRYINEYANMVKVEALIREVAQTRSITTIRKMEEQLICY